MIPLFYSEILNPEELIVVLISVIMAFIGSLSKDYINLMRKGDRMKIGRIVISTVSASIIAYTFSFYILKHFSFRGLIGISYFCGLLGFELVNKLSNLTGVIQILKLLALDSDKLEKLEENLNKLNEIDSENETEKKVSKLKEKVEAGE